MTRRATPYLLDVTVDAAYDEAVGPVTMASRDISRVLLNLMSNAYYAVHEKRRTAGPGFAPVLTIRTRSLGDRVEMRVRDNGTGIAPEIADKIFNPFFTTKPTGEGTGLGLSISYDVVVQGHRGELRMETAPGEHTELIIALPRQAPIGA